MDSIRWRWGWYLSAIMGAIVGVAGWWGLPVAGEKEGGVELGGDSGGTDWVGTFVASGALGFISYVLA